MSHLTRRGLVALLAAVSATPVLAQPRDRPLPSWNDGQSRDRLLDFVRRVTTPGSDFVPPEARIAVFDNDGTLWLEQPIYTEARFLADRIRALVEANPDLRQKQPYKAVVDKDLAALAKTPQADLVKMIDDIHAGMDVEAYEAIAADWIATARDERFKRPFTDLVYQPQLELLAFLRAAGFRTFIVSGGTIALMRTFALKTYGIPPEQVIGSSGKTTYELRDDRGVIVSQAGIGGIDDKAGKPVNIHLHIGRRPILAFGNSDGDLEMLQYTTSGDGPRLGLIVRHDDGVREYAYDRAGRIGTLDKALDEAPKWGWQVVSMKNDWNRVFPFEAAKT
jgi:phosphoglycolate phosphatase-like HAD superfamily hydrolase